MSNKLEQSEEQLKEACEKTKNDKAKQAIKEKLQHLGKEVKK